MGTETAPTATDGTIITASHVNTLADMMQIDFVPRNSSGVPTDVAGALGSTSYKWLKAFIESGYWNVGDIKAHHSYNGAAGPGHGWFLCDGSIINEANYEAQSWASVGDWDEFVGSSPRDGKYAPNFTDKYPVGAATTTQDGTSAITAVGNAGSEIDIQHNHVWYNATGVSSDDQTFDVDGSAVTLIEAIKSTSARQLSVVQAISTTALGDSWTTKVLSASQDIQPESIEVQFYIRII